MYVLCTSLKVKMNQVKHSVSQDSITHTENSDKASIEIEWTAPPAGTGPVHFA